jgi:glycosyltransferase involved in cell wall biosynthesis
MDLVIHAPNVHLGGGLSLLAAILECLDQDFHGCVVLDERVDLPIGFPDHVPVHRVRPTVVGRLLGEWRLRSWAGTNDVILCFGNLPPLFRLQGKILVFVQNRYQVVRGNLKGFPLPTRLKMMLESFWLAWRKRNVGAFVVQTPSMQRASLEHLKKPSTVLPFVKHPEGYKRRGEPFRISKNASYDFVYVASGEPHKNHRRLIEAWGLLAKEGIRPSLCLTLDKNRFFDLCNWVENMKNDLDLNISNVGNLPPGEIQGLYNKARALIHPSQLESLPLPLIEARCAGIPILASERDYVRDVIDPEHTFDPNSPVSIALAVKRFMDIPEPPLPLMDAKTYLAKIGEIDLA